MTPAMPIPRENVVVSQPLLQIPVAVGVVPLPMDSQPLLEAQRRYPLSGASNVITMTRDWMLALRICPMEYRTTDAFSALRKTTQLEHRTHQMESLLVPSC